jgi:signal transduction histidine kinase/CheY-like chemotaxis protein
VRLLATTREQLLDRELRGIGLFPDKTRLERALEELHEKGVFRSDELQIQTQTCELRHLELVSNLYVEKDSTILQFNVRDITDRVENAQQLATARDAAEEANRAKDKFLAALSHELRTPLTPVLMVSSAMERSGNLPSGLRDAFVMIRKNIQQEARLIDDLLDITGMVQGRLKFHFKNLHLHPLIHESLESLRATIDKKQLEISLELSAPEHHVNADAVRIRQIFGNLFGNAVKFAPSLGKIAVRTSNALGNLHIEVFNTGLGIPEEELTHIFNEFVQGNEAVVRFGGVGLGLFTAAFLVRGHGGRIWGESGDRDKGAFSLNFPFRQLRRPYPLLLRRRRLLIPCEFYLSKIINQPARRLLNFLPSKVMPVSKSESIAQARALAKANAFDVVICDLGLPDGRGYDLMRELKRDFLLPGIALSGYGMETDVLQSQEAGFTAHLTKPVQLATLEEAIQRALITEAKES